MTTSIERPGITDSAAVQITVRVPEETRKQLRHELGELAEQLGERWIGGPWRPDDDRSLHMKARLRDVGIKFGHATLLPSLKRWSGELAADRVHLLLFLWQECWQLWDSYLIYETLNVVTDTVCTFTGSSPGLSDDEEPPQAWEEAASRVAGRALLLIKADAAVFKQIVLSDPEALKAAADDGLKVTGRIIADIEAALQCPRNGTEDEELAASGLRFIAGTAGQNRLLYLFLAAAAVAVQDFHAWLAVAPRYPDRPGTRPLRATTGAEAETLKRQILVSIDDALSRYRAASETLSEVVLSRAEPWEQLLYELRDIAGRADAKAPAAVFVPRRVSIRYCYPFAINADEDVPEAEIRDLLNDPDDNYRHIASDLAKELSELSIDVQDVRPLDPTAFFAAGRSGGSRYGGVCVELPDVFLDAGRDGQQPSRCRVWLALSRLGNHCLCIERAPLETPLPHDVYRAMTAGAPFIYGIGTRSSAVAANGAATEAPEWDNLHSFARDVIRQTAEAAFWRNQRNRESGNSYHYVRGNMHEVAIVRTDTPLAKEAAGIADKLNSSLGGTVLLRSVQSTPATADEWIRYPATRIRTSSRTSGIANLPEMGLAGDWFAHTGESTIFGITAAPSWQSDAYAEATQFASSWSPLMRVWSGRLQAATEAARSSEGPGAPGQPGRPGKNPDEQADALREVERAVRQQLTIIQAEDLCATLAQRRFLDQLLEMSGVPQLQQELESQLLVAERLLDWQSEKSRKERDSRRQHDEDQRRRTERRRDGLLAVIALFGMFELGGFLELANSTDWHQRIFGFSLHEGVWEDWLVSGLFVVAVATLIVLYRLDRLRSIQRPRSADRPER